eukprot:13897317-Ditylum_brightwellii.AAC.1
MPEVKIQGHTISSVKNTQLLGVILDYRLTMADHCKYLVREGKRRLSKLCCLANSNWGPSQSSMRNTYVTYIRSLFDYGAPAWYSLMAKTNLEKLQRIQNKALRAALGTPQCT